MTRQLLAAGVEVHGVTRTVPAEPATPGLTWHRVEADTEAVLVLFDAVRPEIVFHLAACYRREHKPADIAPLIEANVLFGTRILEGMRAAGCRRMVTAGTFFQHFGPAENKALNLYAATKQAFLDVVNYYADACALSAVWLTLYEIYGEQDRRAKLMTTLADRAAAGTTIDLPGDEFWVDLLHVDDVAAACRHAAGLTDTARPGVLQYSVSSGRDVAGGELVDLFGRIGGRTVAVNRGAFVPPARNMARPWRGVPLPGWTPSITLEEGVTRLLDERRRRGLWK